jgi:hypothetical protein
MIMHFDWIGTNEKIQLKVIYWSENNGKILENLSLRIQWHFLCQDLRFNFWLNWIQRENLIRKVDYQEFKVDNNGSK